MNKFFRQLHLWLSVPFGLIITIICFTGAMLVFESEITEHVNSKLLRVEPQEETMPIGKLMRAVSATLPDTVSATSITISSDPADAWQVQLSKPRRASVRINQYTGEVLGRYERLPFFSTMFGLHRWLLMNPVGKTIVGISTLVFVLILISGIVVWIPKNRNMLANRLKISTKHGWRRFWYDLHVAGGIYAVVLLLAMSLTGLTWSFPWYRNAFYAVFGVETSQMQNSHGGGEQQKVQNGQQTDRSARIDNQQHHTDNINYEKAIADTLAHKERGNRQQANATTGATQKTERNRRVKGLNTRQWNKVYNILQEKYASEGYNSITILDGKAQVSLSGFGNQRASDSYTFNAENGEIETTKLYADSNKAQKLRGWIFSVHVGSWGGMFTRILAFLAALLGASLPLTGYYLWIKRKFLK